MSSCPQQGLAAVRRLTQALAELPHVATVHSLTNAQDTTQLSLTPFGIAVPRLIPDDVLAAEQIAAIRRNEQVIGTLLAADLHTAGLLVVPDDARMAASVRETWIAAVRAVAAQHAVHGRRTYVAGTPLERSDVTRYIQRDQRRIIPVVLLVLLGVTYSIYRVKRFAVLSLACVLMSLTWTMGVVGFVGVPLNVITALLPAVIMVVSVSVAIHLINQFIDEIEARGQRHGGSRERGEPHRDSVPAHLGDQCPGILFAPRDPGAGHSGIWRLCRPWRAPGLCGDDDLCASGVTAHWPCPPGTLAAPERGTSGSAPRSPERLGRGASPHGLSWRGAAAGGHGAGDMPDHRGHRHRAGPQT